MLKEVFIWAYERSVKQYATVQQILGKPDPFRLLHSTVIRQIIGYIIGNNMSKEDANAYIEALAQKLPAADRAPSYLITTCL